MGATEVQEQIAQCIGTLPGLPSDNPTPSAWQDPPSSIAHAQSAALPKETDFVVIGSGITGCSAVYHLLNHPNSTGQRVTLLEARGSVSGATGRNGGHLVSEAVSVFHELVAGLGPEMAVDILRFSEANVSRVKEVVAELTDAERDASELRPVTATLPILDENMLAEVKANLEMLDKLAPDSYFKYRLMEGEEAFEKYKHKSGVAVLEIEGVAALWPYRLFNTLLENLLRDFKGRFNLETNTPVISIDHTESGYRVNTKRGPILAKKVIHCTNGYAAHLSPGLLGMLYPLRGTMSVQRPGSAFPRLGDVCSWMHKTKTYIDPETSILHTGLYYAQQNCHTGDIWIGGDSQPIKDLLNSDDSVISAAADDHIRGILPKLFRDTDGCEPHKVWSGIMGFTADSFPLIGQLTPTLTGRGGDGEWISVGCNGHGMDKSWLSGEAVARMALGEDAPAWLPIPYRISEERLAPYTVEAVSMGVTEKLCS